MTPSPALSALALTWGLGGVVALLGSAIWRLTPRTLEALGGELSGGHWAFAAAWAVFMLYAEGYRGFQLRFSPTCASRAFHLAAHPTAARLLLAPLFCMGFFGGSRRRLITSWLLTSTIIVFVLIVQRMPQPWRGLVDGGVVLGLSWGVASLVLSAVALGRGAEPADPQLPLAEAGAPPGRSALDLESGQRSVG